jgi:serine/threonine-protein kinase
MVADFGIALAVSAAAGGRMTETGLSLGTPHYMSPEQATAEKDLTNRSDVYSLGAVLYEMLTGDPPHKGSTAQQIIMKIVTDEPRSVSELRKTVPPNVAAATAKALEKLPADRFESAEAMARALSDPAFGHVEALGVAAALRGAGRRQQVALLWPTTLTLAGTLVLVAGVFGWLVGRRSQVGEEPGPTASSSVVRFTIDLPVGDTLAGDGPSVAISPDGSLIVWAAERDGTRRLFRREVAGLAVEPIPGTEGGSAPFFSPNGEWIGFFADGSLRKVATVGGSPGEISAAPVGAGSWGANDEIVIGSPVLTRQRRGLWRVAAAGGDAQRLLPQAGMWPHHVAGVGDRLFYTSRSQGEWQVSLYDRGSGEARVFFERGTQGRSVPTGHVVYAWNGSLMAAPFDPDAREPTEPPASVVDGVWTDRSGAAHFSVSRHGRLVYATGQRFQSPDRRLVWVDRSGAVDPLPMQPDLYSGPRVSPNGETVVLQITRDQVQLWTFQVDRPVLRLLTEGTATEYWPTWDPTGRFVGHNSDRHDGPLNLYVTPVDGSAPGLQLIESDRAQTASSWRNDGGALAYQTYGNPETSGDIWVYSFDDSVARPFLRTPAEESLGEFSPDGKWMAYISDASGRYEVYVKPYPGPGGVETVSAGGGMEPVWAASGRELFYRDLTGQRVYAVSVDNDPELQLGLPVMLFEGAFANGSRFGRIYDVTPDGRRFLMLEMPLPTNSTRLVVVDGWFNELQRRLDSR